MLQFSGEGNQINGSVGDLLIQFNISPSRVFERIGDNIHVKVKVDLKDALLGGSIVVPSIHGDLEMKIPAGTQPNEIKRLAGKGISRPNSNKSGDQYVNIDVSIPRLEFEIHTNTSILNFFYLEICRSHSERLLKIYLESIQTHRILIELIPQNRLRLIFFTAIHQRKLMIMRRRRLLLLIG